MTVDQVAEHISEMTTYSVSAGGQSYPMMAWASMVEHGGQGSADIVLANLAGTIVGDQLTWLNQGQAAFFVQEQADGARLGVGVNQAA
ncbi:hypothetical protein [Caulobacter endophyticus]|uniref:Uncharacterized protein n=1 Tax=Caulobacter endophyticus TaxID=2172652 RepID=A0A2T9JEA7_9CAUL|nr:hypothetical protein [Caulobacter endophyticus]PVM82008.1 hypothetical protein DDF67_23615 [Caulobacter endophyticus]